MSSTKGCMRSVGEVVGGDGTGSCSGLDGEPWAKEAAFELLNSMVISMEVACSTS
jgi:hypothetical protein